MLFIQASGGNSWDDLTVTTHWNVHSNDFSKFINVAFCILKIERDYWIYSIHNMAKT